jgi:hypothetical protein
LQEEKKNSGNKNNNSAAGVVGQVIKNKLPASA